MRKRLELLAIAFGGLSGCNPAPADYCAAGTPECTPMDGGAGRDGTGGVDATTDTGACDPRSAPSQDSCVVAERFGIFVSPAGSDSNGGTRSSPVATIGHGMDLAKAAGKRVYVCAGVFPDALVIAGSRDGVNVYGGMECAGWSYAGGKQVVVAPTGRGYALTLEGLETGMTLEDVEFDAQSAPDPGESSVAALASNSQNVLLERVTLVAGAGADGSSPPAPDAGTTNWYGTPPSYPELNGASAIEAGAAPATTCTCPDQSSSTGGAASGPQNAPRPAAGLPSYGDGGAGAPGAMGDSCGSGGTGQSGANAPSAAAATGSVSIGSCSESGWTVGAIGTGSSGKPGQGGGGGGDANPLTGAGGGGACGGCGGAGGTAGAGAGSSIALLAYRSNVALVGCLLIAKAGGNGGAGGGGEPGQGGGSPGVGSGQGAGVGCAGGAGGAGSGGNGGQGGAGGFSLGIGYCGTVPTVDGAVVPQAASLGGIELGVAGHGGKGGSGGAAANSMSSAGADGAAGPSGVAMAVRSML